MIEFIESAPVIAGAASAAAGVAIDTVAARLGEHNREAAMSTQGASEAEFRDHLLGRHSRHAGQPEETESPSLLSRVTVEATERARHPWIPVSMALAGSLAVLAWTDQPAQTKSERVLEVVGDRSYVTQQDGSDKAVNSIFNELSKTGKIKVRAELAVNNGHNGVNIHRVNEVAPWGAPTVKKTVADTLRNADGDSDTTVTDAPKGPSSGMLVVTDGNTLGPADEVIHHAGSRPIYIKNVGKVNAQTVNEFKRIAYRTGGKYFDVKTGNADVRTTIEHAMKPQEVATPAPSENKDILKAISLMAVALSIGLTANRAAARFKGPIRDKVITPRKAVRS